MTILDDIVRDKREELGRRRPLVSVTELREKCRGLGTQRDFEAALRPSLNEVRVIAEVKKASPSRGVLTEAFDPTALAKTYADHGAAAISVLTDEKYFQGRLDHLSAVRDTVGVPLLRKDFTIDEYQLWESRAAGADAVLLIVSILDQEALVDLLAAAKGVGLSTLVEVHTPAELDRALGAGARIIGINNRDLKTFETRIETTLDLAPLIPPGPVVVSESGFFTADQVRAVRAAGAHAVLVGEALVRASDAGATLRELSLFVGGERRRVLPREGGYAPLGLPRPDTPPPEGDDSRRQRPRDL